MKVRIYNPNEKKKKRFRTTSSYFIGYPKQSNGYRFYFSNNNTRIVESGNARFIDISGSKKIHDVSIQEARVEVPIPQTSTIVVPQIIVQPNNNKK